MVRWLINADFDQPIRDVVGDVGLILFHHSAFRECSGGNRNRQFTIGGKDSGENFGSRFE